MNIRDLCEAYIQSFALAWRVEIASSNLASSSFICATHFCAEAVLCSGSLKISCPICSRLWRYCFSSFSRLIREPEDLRTPLAPLITVELRPEDTVLRLAELTECLRARLFFFKKSFTSRSRWTRWIWSPILYSRGKPRLCRSQDGTGQKNWCAACIRCASFSCLVRTALEENCMFLQSGCRQIFVLRVDSRCLLNHGVRFHVWKVTR
jgi:hypothetical protein